MGLAAATAVLAFFTWWAVKAAARQADITTEAVELPRKQLATSQRPVVVPLQSRRKVSYRRGELGPEPEVTENPKNRTDLPDYGHLPMTVENVGVGPAMNVRGSANFPRGKAEVHIPVEAIRAGDANVVTFVRSEGWN